MQVERASKGMFLVALMLLASLSGCFGEDETIQEGVPIVFQIDYQMPSDVVLKSGEWHEFQLVVRRRLHYPQWIRHGRGRVDQRETVVNAVR